MVFELNCRWLTTSKEQNAKAEMQGYRCPEVLSLEEKREG